MIDDRLGNPLYAVFAASTRIAAVANCRSTNSGPVAEHLQAELRDHRAVVARVRLRAGARAPRCRRTACRAARPSTRASPPRSSPPGRRNAGTPFEIASTPVSATAPDEKPFSSRKMPSVPPISRLPSNASGSYGTGGDVAEERAGEAVDDERAEHQHVEVGGDREDPSRLLDAAHVQQRDEHDEHRRPSSTRWSAQARERGDRDDRGDAGRDRHRHREHVVDHQRRAGDERRASRRCSPCSRRTRRRRRGRRRSPAGTRRSRSRAGRATTIAIGTSLLSPSARLDAPTATTKRISSVAYAVDDSASDENTASAIVFESRCSSIWVVASGRPTNSRFNTPEHRLHLPPAAASSSCAVRCA